jgi:hypothetical protein
MVESPLGVVMGSKEIIPAAVTLTTGHSDRVTARSHGCFILTVNAEAPVPSF